MKKIKLSNRRIKYSHVGGGGEVKATLQVNKKRED